MLGRTPGVSLPAHRFQAFAVTGASRRLESQHTPQVRPLRRTPARPDGADFKDRPPWKAVGLRLGSVASGPVAAGDTYAGNGVAGSGTWRVDAST